MTLLTTLRSVVAAVDTTPPNPSVNISNAKISNISGKNSVNITVDAITDGVNQPEPFVEYKVKIVSTPTSTHTMGTLVEQATISSTLSTVINITMAEMLAASAAEGSNTVKVFIKDAAGNWSGTTAPLVPSTTLAPSTSLVLHS